MSRKDLANIEKYTMLYEKYQNLLTQNQRQIFELYFYQDLSYAEIAEITATTRTAAFDAVKKATAKLEKLEKQVYENQL
ncbi:Sigma-70, region 4 [Mycoplasmopsis edwardii]|uniref:Sigma-70, region 4 n=1 Tax=Mycoplasmopsis edwardii TaxID=53558 RepID=A0A3B0PT83_9BACT|nr:sigma factor-like helix-turn-helix DNA-binding protein [Mycoplasmopsis edwardii]SYV96684.1 Sigma-70, region 4 [Mycoplasmopsis edwardii]